MNNDTIAWTSRTPVRPLINTGALARCKNELTTGKLFQQFGASRRKPLKRLTDGRTHLRRAEATVLMRRAFFQTRHSPLTPHHQPYE
jgi:hypothetical protein